jgi:hypothetical protein
MSSEVLLSSIIPFAGSGFLGYAMGFALLFLSRTWLLVKCSSYSVRVLNFLPHIQLDQTAGRSTILTHLVISTYSVWPVYFQIMSRCCLLISS